MNVMQSEKLFQSRREKSRNEAKSREQFTVPFLTNYRAYRFIPTIEPRRNANYGSATKWKPVGSNYSNGRNPVRTRGSTSSSLLASCSRNHVARSTTKSTTAVGSSMLESGGVIVAITSGRGDARAEVGMAALDVRCPHLILCQISDSQTYTNTLTKLHVFEPIQVLMPDTMCEPVASKNILYRSIMDKFFETQVTPISRIHFNDMVGLERVRTLCAAEYSSVELFVKQKYYALAATAALFKYAEYSQRIVYCPKSIRIEFQGSPNATSIDLESARSLELVQSQCGQRNISLLGILDRCSTPMGRKLLRANILQPPCEERVIVERQSAIAELVSNRALRILLQPILRRLYGADRLAALSTVPVFHENSVQCAEQNLNYVLLLKNMLDVVPELEEALSSAETDLLRKIRKRLENPRFQLMKERILEKIHPDARSVSGYTSSNMQRCFAIKAGINDLLDVARRTYCELIDDMKSMVENLAAKYKLPFSLGCNASHGYHIQAILPRNSTETLQLPTEFIEVRRNRRIYMMTTSALATLSQQCKIASEELHLMSNVLLCDLLQIAREYIGCLFQLSTDVAELDVINSLAQASSHHAYVRPTFGTKLELLDSRHPVLEVFGLDDPVPNNISASIPWNFHIISGPNMSGKSTYLKQIVLLHIMAQIGCFVPAKQAMFRITNLIFCKIAVRDDIECNASTFALEMKEAQYILRSITSTSLIVLDELCKGTAIEEGASIAWAICEWLLDTTAFVFVATHFAYLTKLAHLYCNVTNHYFETTSAKETSSDSPDSSYRFVYTHRLKLGMPPHTDDYGIVLAELSGLPKSITEKARKYASNQTISNRIMTESSSSEHTCYNIVVEIYQLLERDDFHREKITSQMERIANIPIQNTNEDSVTKVQRAINNIIEVNVERKIDETVSNDSTSKKIKADSTKQQHTVDKIEACGEIDFKEISPLSNHVILSNEYDQPISNQSKRAQTEHFQFRNNDSFDFCRSDHDELCRRSFNSFDSLSSYSLTAEHLSNKMEKSSVTFDNIKSRFVDQLGKNDSIDSIISETAPSLSITHDLSPMQMSILSKASTTRLYEYCLSDFDLEPLETSHTFNHSNESVIASDTLTNF